MTLINPIKKIRITSFTEFCTIFNITTNLVAGDDGTDEELIINELNKFTNTKWIMNFVDTKEDGYFLLQQLI